MSKSLYLAAFGLFALLSGCGGSESDGVAPGPDSDFSVYTTQLPDGAEMDLVLAETVGGEWSGAMNEASETNPAENTSGMFSGTRTGNLVAAQIMTDTGATFEIEGSYRSDGTIHLVRSDLPGVTLVFRAVEKRSPPATRSTVKFYIQFTGSVASPITASSVPTMTDANFTYYLGTVDKTQQKVSISVRKVQPIVVLYLPLPNYTALQIEQPVTSFEQLTTTTVTSTGGLGQLSSVNFKTPGAKTGPL
ncbi:MAG TPA: hypothetical protein VK934_00705 [Fimbriimonas sp.]|nr:hypothetical protein [Fimbriimonas sp.]